MSGYDDFRRWIDSDAKYLFTKKGTKCEIKGTFFTSSPGHNSDDFNIRTDHGTMDWDSADFSELRERYELFKNK